MSEHHFEHHTEQINGIRLHYVTEGTGPLIVFLHGFPEFWYAWKEQLIEFGRDHLAVAPDLRGYNLSDKPQGVEQYRMHLLLEDIRQLIAHLGAQRCILVGHDWGGAVAWAFAIFFPQFLEKLIIINSPHPVVFQRELRENPAQQQASQYMLTFRRPDAEERIGNNSPDGLVEGSSLASVLSPEDLAMYRQAWAQPGALTAGLNYYRASGLGPVTTEAGQELPPINQLPPITVPTLVIWGEQDKALLTGNLQGLDQYVSNLTIKRIPEGTHWVIHEQPTLVNKYIRDFIA